MEETKDNGFGATHSRMEVPKFFVNWRQLDNTTLTGPDTGAAPIDVLEHVVRRLELEQSSPRGSDDGAKLLWDLSRAAERFRGELPEEL